MIAANGRRRGRSSRRAAWPRCAACCARPSAGTASSSSPPQHGGAAAGLARRGRRWRRFLITQRDADPERFPDLSLAVVKLLGKGEYAAWHARGHEPTGHFSRRSPCATTRTPPRRTRRFPDLVSQRLVKAALGRPRARVTAADELDGPRAPLHRAGRRRREGSSARCGNRRRRCCSKHRLGERFDAPRHRRRGQGAPWVRITRPPVEGPPRAAAPTASTSAIECRLTLKSTGPSRRGFVDFRGAPELRRAAALHGAGLGVKISPPRRRGHANAHHADWCSAVPPPRSRSSPGASAAPPKGPRSSSASWPSRLTMDPPQITDLNSARALDQADLRGAGGSGARQLQGWCRGSPSRGRSRGMALVYTFQAPSET